ncbi:MAG: hypothetical protein WC333_02260 [Dehalococcoidia bacterium]|jgi:hypothetical protein
MGKKVCLYTTFKYHKFALSEIHELQDGIFVVLDEEILNNTNYRKYFDQTELRATLRWIKKELTIDTLRNFILDDNYVHTNMFKYDHWNDSIKIPLTHIRDFVIEKTLWKYCCPECQTMGEITVNKDEKIKRHSIKCDKCGCNFYVNN